MNDFNSFNSKPPPLYSHGSQIPQKQIINIEPEVYIGLFARTPKIDIDFENGIETLGKVNKFTDLLNVISGGYSSVSAVTQTMIEKSLDIDSCSLARSANEIQRKNLSQYGLGIYVRIKYEHFEDGWFSDGYVTKYTDWTLYTGGGLTNGMAFGGLAGSYESFDDAKKDIRKAIIWMYKKFAEENK